MKRTADVERPRPLRYARGLEAVRRLPIDTRELERKITRAYERQETRAA